MSNSPEMKHPRGQHRAIWRPALLIGALTALILTVAVACGGNDNDEPSRTNPVVEMQTFTPTVEGATPPANATRDARATEQAATATHQAENSTPAPTRDPNATQVVPTVDPDEEEGMRPPRVWLDDGNRQWEGVFGNFQFVDEPTGTVANAVAPFYDVGDDGLTVAPGGELEFILQEDMVAPSSMTGEPTRVNVEVYTWEGNNAIPTGTDGSVEDNLWFVPSGPPMISSPMDLNASVFTMPAQPDRYVVRVEIVWEDFSNQDTPQPIPIYAVYAFTVYVE